MSMSDADGAAAAAGGPGARTLTVARVRDARGGGGNDGDVEVLFLESARFYHVRRSNPRFENVLAVLREAIPAGRPLRVRFASPGGDVIEDVRPG
jgi:hypothetical protein